MKKNYYELLKDYPDKGTYDKPEIRDPEEDFDEKINLLAEKWREAKFVYVLTGAGISTSAGIADFRGPNGVWTRQDKGLEVIGSSFEDAIPTKTHMALVVLEKMGKIQWLVSQNVDNLHLRSGFPRNRIAELHGNSFMEKCKKCKREFVREISIESVGFKETGRTCEGTITGRSCRGKLQDICLDWDDELPKDEFNKSCQFLKKTDLFISLGSSLMIDPVGLLPLQAQKNGAHTVTVAIQPTKHEKKISHTIHANVDTVFERLSELMNFQIPLYKKTNIVWISTHAIASWKAESKKRSHSIKRKAENENGKSQD